MVPNPEVLSAVEYPPTPDRPWTVRCTFGLLDGKAAVLAVEVYAVAPAAIAEAMDADWPALHHQPPGTHAVTSVGLRLPLGSMLTAYLRKHRRAARVVAASPRFSSAARRSAARHVEAIRPPGRPPLYGREHFEQVASVYLEALAEGRPPTGAVAEKFMVSRSAAAKWVSTARERWGLLPRTSKGRSAAWPGGRESR